MAFEGVEAAGQFGAVGLEPLVEFPQRLGAEAVEATLGVAADLDEAGIAEDLEVSGHTGLVHADAVNELGHRSLTVPNGVEDPTASGFGDHVEDSELSGHRINIRPSIYIVQADVGRCRGGSRGISPR